MCSKGTGQICTKTRLYKGTLSLKTFSTKTLSHDSHFLLDSKKKLKSHKKQDKKKQEEK